MMMCGERYSMTIIAWARSKWKTSGVRPGAWRACSISALYSNHERSSGSGQDLPTSRT